MRGQRRFSALRAFAALAAEQSGSSFVFKRLWAQASQCWVFKENQLFLQRSAQVQYYSTRAPTLSFREKKDLEAQFSWYRSFVCIFPRVPLSVSWSKTALFVFFVRPWQFAVYVFYIRSDRPRLYENQSDLPPNIYSLEKTGPRVEYSTVLSDCSMEAGTLCLCYDL
jgi:hypothetical protein